MFEGERLVRGRWFARYGDLFAYALARVSDEALLFTGEDFTRTDVRHVF